MMPSAHSTQQRTHEREPRPDRAAPVGIGGGLEVMVGALRVAHHAGVVHAAGAGFERRKKVRRVLARSLHRCATTALVGGGVTVTRSMTVDVSCVGAFMPSCRVAMASTRAGPTRDCLFEHEVAMDRPQPCLLPAQACLHLLQTPRVEVLPRGKQHRRPAHMRRRAPCAARSRWRA